MSHSFGATTTGDAVVTAFADRVKGRVFLITGPTPVGLGAATAYALAGGHPASILLVGRSPEKYGAVVEKIRSIDANIDVRVYAVDLGDIASTHEGAKKIAAEVDHIDVLINNAGVGGVPYKKTKDGIEEHFATNHIGHFLLTNILMPVILKSKEPTVVNLTSGAQAMGTGDYSDSNFEKTEYSWSKGYAQSKLANVHFTQSLATKLGPRGLVSFSVHPGVIWGTSLMSPLSDEDAQNLREFSKNFTHKTPEQGVSTTLVAALDRRFGLKNNGAYLVDCQVAADSGNGAKVPGAADKLWELSEALVGERFAY
ncbi:putative short-chain dehydrogenase [Auricularia subglabra TFB-10046 SS5]|nr:putative short-chain dehydrogenase [Auricularia subglabra TFB-10046 SS5]